MPFFTIIIPVYNRAKLIEQTLCSVFNQTFTDYEVVVVDDGSTDDTPAVLSRLAGRIRAVRQKNSGPAGARNRGMACATGNYIAFLDSDDLWFPWTLATFRRAIEENRNPALLLAQPLRFSDVQQIAGYRPGLWGVRRYPDFLSAVEEPFFLGSGATVVRNDAVYGKIRFPEVRFNGEDMHFLLQLGAVPGFVVIDSPLTFACRQHSASEMASQDKTYRGLCFLVQSEKCGAYGVGVGRRRDRRRFLALHLRSWCVTFLRWRNFGRAFRLYFMGLWWQVRLKRFRFLLGMPAAAVWSAISGWSIGRKSSRQAVHSR
jgi:glycosyltransferase involved in cell wall biosynthesis